MPSGNQTTARRRRQAWADGGRKETVTATGDPGARMMAIGTDSRACIPPALRGLLLAALALLFPVTIAAEDLAVLYPKVSGAYVRVFERIIDGIEQETGGRVVTRTLVEDEPIQEVRSWLRQSRVDALITLGQQGYQAAKALRSGFPVVVGGALISPNGVTGISMAADPEQFFARLGSLTPPVERVFVVYSEADNGWLVARARRLADAYDIELVAREANSIRDAVQHYAEVLEKARDASDAIWLPLETVAPDKTILPLVLEAAWKRNLVVFSNKPSHVRQGVLFSLFPDHLGMGRRLARMATRAARPGGGGGVEPLRDLKVAVNLRTASHLGMLYSARQRRDFALVFPGR